MHTHADYAIMRFVHRRLHQISRWIISRDGILAVRRPGREKSRRYHLLSSFMTHDDFDAFALNLYAFGVYFCR